MATLYLIKRGERPKYHLMPFHQVIVCDRKPVAQWEAGSTGDHAWVWTHAGIKNDGGGWLLERWNGLDIDYGHVVSGEFVMPDGAHVAFYRDYEDSPKGIRDYLKGAIWWTDKIMPDCWKEMGVVYPSDDHSQQRILDIIADDGMMGCRRKIPKHWRRGTR